jgi:hypothetical protein
VRGLEERVGVTDGKHLIRFAFCKDETMLNQAIQRLEALR